MAYVYDIGRLADLKALSESGHRVVFVDGRVLVGADSTEFAGCWVVEDVATQRLHAEHGATSLEEIAEDYDGELVKGRGHLYNTRNMSDLICLTSCYDAKVTIRGGKILVNGKTVDPGGWILATRKVVRPLESWETDKTLCTLLDADEITDEV